MWGEKVKKNYGFKLIRVVVSLALLKSSRKEEETINRILKEIFCSQTNPTPLTSKESKKRGRGMEKWKTEKKKLVPKLANDSARDLNYLGRRGDACGPTHVAAICACGAL